MTSALNHRYPAIQGELEDEFEAEWEAEDEFETASAGSEYEDEWELEAEDEAEDEYEAEDEDFVNPIRRIYPDAELMAHLAAQAARTESESEAEAFIGALVPLAARLIPRAGKLLMRHAPTLIRGATRISRQLRRSPAARKLVAAVPVIVQRTAQSLADQAAAGRPVDGDAVLRTMTTMAGRVLSAPASRTRAVRAVRTFDRRYHRRCRAQLGRPVPTRRPNPPRRTVRRGRRRR
jgi:hypothetical protein